jgi:hypothetical protein
VDFVCATQEYRPGGRLPNAGEGEQALNKIFPRIYEGDDGEIVVGTRSGIETQQYVETEFVFQGGELVTAHIGAAGEDFIAKTPQTDMFVRDQLKALGL